MTLLHINYTSFVSCGCISIMSMVDNGMPGVWPVWTPGAPLAGFIKRSTIHCSKQNMKALGYVVSEKIFIFMFFLL